MKELGIRRLTALFSGFWLGAQMDALGTAVDLKLALAATSQDLGEEMRELMWFSCSLIHL